MFLVPENVTAVIVRFSQLLFSNNVKDVTIGSLYSCQQNAIGSYFCWRLHSRFVLTKPLILDFEICLPSSYLWKLLLTKGGGYDDFQLSHHLTWSAHQTSIFRPKHPILVPKCLLSTFLTILENSKFRIFFNFGESLDPESIFLQNFFACFLILCGSDLRNLIQGLGDSLQHRILRRFLRRRESSSPWDKFHKSVPQ